MSGYRAGDPLGLGVLVQLAVFVLAIAVVAITTNG